MAGDLMLDYLIKWEDCLSGIPVAQLPTPVISEMLGYIDEGGDVQLEEAESRQAVAERMRLELEIRAWGMRSE